MKDLIKIIKEHEGFVGEPYNDSLGIATIGIGTKLPIDEEEAEMLLKHRLDKKISKLLRNKPIVIILSKERQEVLFDMAYQLGVSGLLRFTKMWLAIESGDFGAAAAELLDSKYARQTKNRAERNARILGGLSS